MHKSMDVDELRLDKNSSPVPMCALTLSSDVDQDTKMFGLHERSLYYQCIIS